MALSDATVNRSLNNHLARNPMVWQVMVQHGVKEHETPLAIDFFYEPGSVVNANKLASFLRAETDYRVEVDVNGFLRKKGTVRGTTQPQPLSLQIIQDWSTWMVAAGAQFDIVFDGWGAPLNNVGP